MSETGFWRVAGWLMLAILALAVGAFVMAV